MRIVISNGWEYETYSYNGLRMRVRDNVRTTSGCLVDALGSTDHSNLSSIVHLINGGVLNEGKRNEMDFRDFVLEHEEIESGNLLIGIFYKPELLPVYASFVSPGVIERVE